MSMVLFFGTFLDLLMCVCVHMPNLSIVSLGPGCCFYSGAGQKDRIKSQRTGTSRSSHTVLVFITVEWRLQQ